jgi:hypothetical protein
MAVRLPVGASEGAGIRYGVADAPAAAFAPAASDASAGVGSSPREGILTASNHRPQLSAALWKIEAARVTAGAAGARPLLRIPERTRAAQLVKGQHR